MFVNRAHPPPPRPASVNLVLQHGGKPYKVSIALFVDYSYYSRTIRTIRRLFADYSYYSSTIRGLFVLFVDYSHYSHYSLHYSSFINCPCWIHEVALLNTSSCFVEYICRSKRDKISSFTYLHQVVCWIHQVACVLHQVYQSKIIQVGIVVFIHQEGREPTLIRSKFQLINKLEGGRVLKNLWQIFHGGWKK